LGLAAFSTRAETARPLRAPCSMVCGRPTGSIQLERGRESAVAQPVPNVRQGSAKQLDRPLCIGMDVRRPKRMIMQRFKNAREAALVLRPDAPVYCFRPDVLKADARHFMQMFPGKTAYAVKTNGEQIVLAALAEAGVTAFDVASPAEFAAVRAVSPEAE